MQSGSMPPPTTLIGTLVAYFVTTTVIALLVAALGITKVSNAIELGVLLGVGFGVAMGFVSQIYEQKGSSYWLINGIPRDRRLLDRVRDPRALELARLTRRRRRSRARRGVSRARP